MSLISVSRKQFRRGSEQYLGGTVDFVDEGEEGAGTWPELPSGVSISIDRIDGGWGRDNSAVSIEGNGICKYLRVPFPLS